MVKKVLFILTFLVTNLSFTFGQEPATVEKAASYIKAINERANKIVATLKLSDSAKITRVQSLITQQYLNLNAIHEHKKIGTKKTTDPKQKECLENEARIKLATLHHTYLSNLAIELSDTQIEKIKDGMTYGVVPVTYKGYQAMLPHLTEHQKQQILAWLIEAREQAMDEDSSEKKHATFGKYKGRINNYLSASGIDMKKASKEWEERIAKEASQAQK